MRKIASIALIFILTLVLFACQTETFIVSYDLDGGFGLINDEIVLKNELATRPETDPTKEGYEFLYWEVLGEKFDFTIPIFKDITIKAKWDLIEVIEPEINYLITFDSDGGTSVESIEVPYGQLLTKPEDPTKENMIFLGWYLGNEEFNFNTKITKEMTLKARWQKEVIPVVKYTVTFDSNEGTPVLSQEVIENSYVAMPKDPTRDGYTFRGWYLGDLVFKISTKVTEDITLVAKWDLIIKYQITFDSKGGSSVKEQELFEDEKVVKPTDPVKGGFIFKGWYLNNNLYDFNKVVTESFTLIAQWTEIIKYTITFDTGTNTEIDDLVLGENEKVSKPGELIKDGYIFRGWYLGDDLYDFDQVVTKDLELVAKWVNENDLFKVTIEQNNGEEDLVLHILPDSLITDELNLNYEGFGFVGVYRDFEFEDEFDLTKDIITEDTTLFVRWAEIVSESLDLTEHRGTNMIVEDNNAYRLGLDNNYFDVRTSGSSTRTGVYEEIRIYANGLLEFRINESFVIDKLEIKYSHEYNSKDIVMKLDDKSVIVSNYSGKRMIYENLDITYFSFKANTDRIYINDITISYYQVGEDVLREDDINRPEFDFGEDSLIISNVGDTINIPAIEAKDEEDGLIVAEIDHSKTNINITLIGVYYIHYLAEDEDGNIGYGYITVIIREETILTDYYGEITSEGGNLQDELSLLLKETSEFVNYGTAKEVLEISDRDPNKFDNVWLIYNSASIKGKWQHPNYAREHVWAKSQFGGNHSISNNQDGLGKKFDDSYIGAASDLQNLRAINPSVNSIHSNHKFGINSSTGEWGLVPDQPVTTFFPGDEHKGDVARIILYMLLVWDIEPREDISMLLNWHNLDPVDNFEIIRNEVIYSYQGNRNPFIDYPELAEKAFLIN